MEDYYRMNQYRFLILLAAIVAFFFTSCASDTENIPDVSDVSVSFKVRRLDREMRQLHSKTDVVKFLNENPRLAGPYFGRGQYPHDSILVNNIYDFVSLEVGNDTLYQDIERVFGDFRDVEEEFRKAFQYVKHYYPDFQAPDIYTVASGFSSFGWGNDLFFGKGYIVVGLDYFIGSTATYRPQPSAVPDYMLRRLEKQYIVPTAMTLFSQSLIANDFLDQSLLADMIFYGKSQYFLSKVLPTYSDTLLIGYTEQDLVNVYHNQEDIYAHFVQKQLFFATTPHIKQKYVDERPNVPEIADVCPGRIGRWLGWQIVKSYMYHHEDVTFQEMLKNTNAQQIFQESRYQPAPPK